MASSRRNARLKQHRVEDEQTDTAAVAAALVGTDTAADRCGELVVKQGPAGHPWWLMHDYLSVYYQQLIISS